MFLSSCFTKLILVSSILAVTSGLTACGSGSDSAAARKTSPEKKPTPAISCMNNVTHRSTQVMDDAPITVNSTKNPLSAEKLTHNGRAFGCVYGDPKASVPVAMANGEPYVINIDSNEIHYPDGWNTNYKAKDTLFTGGVLYTVDDQNNLAIFHSHGDHFHFGKRVEVPQMTINSQPELLVNPNNNKLYVFDQHSGELFYKEKAEGSYTGNDDNTNSTTDATAKPSYKILPTRLATKLKSLSLKAEHIVWLGQYVDPDYIPWIKQEYPKKAKELETLVQGRFLVVGKNSSGQQKLIMLNANALAQDSKEKLIISTQDLAFKVTDVKQSPGYRYGLLYSDTDKDNKDNIAFLDSGTFFKEGTQESVVNPPKLLKNKLSAPNPLAINYQINQGLAGVWFKGNKESNARFAVFNDADISKGKVRLQSVKDKKDAQGLVEPLGGDRVLVVTDNQLTTYMLDGAQFKPEKQRQVACKYVQGAYSTPYRSLISCSDGILKATTQYTEAEKQKIVLGQLNLDPKLIETLQYAYGNVEFPTEPTDEKVKAYLASIESISFNNAEIHNPLSLKGIEYLTNIKSLYVNGRGSLDEKKIHTRFPKLTTLSLGNTTVTDFSFINNLPNLESLAISENGLKDLSFLRNHSKITSLSLNNNEIADISILSNLTELKELELGYNKLAQANLTPLVSLNKLESLGLQGNKLTKLPNLSANTALSNLNVMENKLTELSAIANLPKLSSISAGNNKVSSLSTLVNVPALTDLNMTNNLLGASSKADIDRLVSQGTAVTIYQNPEIQKLYDGKDYITAN